MNIFVQLLFGHLLGDFVLQPAAMAVKKGANNLIAFTHVAIYTFSIALFTNFNWKWLAFVFVTHFVVDRWSLADKWLQLIKGRDLPGFFFKGHENIPEFIMELRARAVEKGTLGNVFSQEFRDKEEKENSNLKLNYRILRGGFSSIVYTVTDNTFHLISMYYAYSYFN